MDTQLRPLRVGEILDVALKIYLKNAGALMKLVLIFVVPSQVLAVLVAASTTPEAFTDFPSAPAPLPPGEVPQIEPREIWTFAVANGIVALLGIVMVILATAACFKAISDAYLGEPVDWRRSLSFAGRKTGSLVWLTFLTFLLLILAFIALVIPAIWLWTAWAVAVPVLLIEGIKGRRALGRSYRLVKGRWWPTFGALLVGYLLAGIVTSIIQFGLQAVTFTDVADDYFPSLVVGGVAAILAALISTPFQAALVVIIYFDLRVRKEAFDLELLARNLGVAPTGTRPDFLPAPPIDSGSQPPYWPPPPGWTPSPPSP